MQFYAYSKAFSLPLKIRVSMYNYVKKQKLLKYPIYLLFNMGVEKLA